MKSFKKGMRIFIASVLTLSMAAVLAGCGSTASEKRDRIYRLADAYISIIGASEDGAEKAEVIPVADAVVLSHEISSADSAETISVITFDSQSVPVADSVLVTAAESALPSQAQPAAVRNAPQQTAAKSAPVITKHPYSEEIYAGDAVDFIARADNYTNLIWYLVKPNQDFVPVTQIYDYFPYADFEDAGSEHITLYNVPSGMDGWGIVCWFFNETGNTCSQAAYIDVDVRPDPAPHRNPCGGAVPIPNPPCYDPHCGHHGNCAPARHEHLLEQCVVSYSTCTRHGTYTLYCTVKGCNYTESSSKFLLPLKHHSFNAYGICTVCGANEE